DHLAYELLAPGELVRSEGPLTTYALARRLQETFGLPSEHAIAYAVMLAAPAPGFERWLARLMAGEKDRTFVELLPPAGNDRWEERRCPATVRPDSPISATGGGRSPATTSAPASAKTSARSWTWATGTRAPTWSRRTGGSAKRSGE